MSDRELDEAECQRILANHVCQLMEIFESVRIFVTRNSGDVTMARDYGGGNFYATLGQVREWLAKQECLAVAYIKRKVIIDDDDDNQR